MASKLSKNSAALRLRRKFEKGLVTPEMAPANMRETYPLFKAHKPRNLRTCFDNMKKEYHQENAGKVFIYCI